MISFAFSILLPLLLTRRLEQEEFGLYKLVFLVVTTTSAILPMGVSLSAYYFLSRDQENRNSTILNILLFMTGAGVLGGAVIVSFPEILTFIAGSSVLEPLAPWIGLLTAFWIVGTFLEIAPIANQEERLGSMLTLGVAVTRTAFLLAAALAFGTVSALIVAAQIHAMVQVGVLLAYLANRFPKFWRSLDLATLRRQLAYALPFGVSGWLFVFQTDLHNYFVSHEFGPAAFAVYSIGCFQLPLVRMLSDAAAGVLIPEISKLQAAGDTEKIIEISMRAGRKMSIVYLPLYAFLTLMGADFLTVLFTDQYLDSLPIFRINLLMLLFNLVPTDPVVRAYPQYRYWMLGLMAILSLALGLSLVWVTPRYGMQGVISTVIFVRFVGRQIVAASLVRLLGMRRKHLYLWRDIGKTAIAAAIAMAATALFGAALSGAAPILRLTACAALFGAVYLALLHSFHVPEDDEVAQLQRLLSTPARAARGLL